MYILKYNEFKKIVNESFPTAKEGIVSNPRFMYQIYVGGKEVFHRSVMTSNRKFHESIYREEKLCMLKEVIDVI